MRTDDGLIPCADRLRVSRRSLLRFAGSVAGTAILAACGGAGAAPTSTAAPQQTASSAGAAVGTKGAASATSPTAAASGGGKSITAMTGTDVETLDPHLTGTRNTEIATEAIYSGLVTRDERNNVVPDLAAEWLVSDDKLTWTFKLNPAAKFSDGSPVTADAVKFSFDRIQDPANKSNYLNLLSPIDRTEVVDPGTVRVVTKQPFAPLLANLSDPGPKILQPAAVKQWGKDYGQHPVGSGAYMLKEWVVGDHVTLVANPQYFKAPAKIGTVVLRAAKEGGARTAALESGQADLITNVPPESVQRLQGKQDLSVLVAPSSFLIFFVLDEAKKPFDDVRVRQAANYAVDRQAIVKSVLGGYGAVANSPLGSGVLGRSEFDPWPFDPAKSKQLLADAGYPNGVDVNMWAPEGRYLKDRQVGEAVQNYLQSAGFRPKLQVLEWGTYVTEIAKTPPVANMWLIGASIPDAYWNLVNNFRTHSSYPDGYSSQKVDDLLAQAAKTFDDAARQNIYTDIQRIIYKDDAVMLYLHGQQQILGFKKGVLNVKPLPFEIFSLSSLDLQ